MKGLLGLALFLVLGWCAEVSAQDTQDSLKLYTLNIVTDSCGNPEMSSTFYFVFKGRLIDIHNNGTFTCELTSDVESNGTLKYRVCTVTLAGIQFDKNDFATIEKLKKLLKGKDIEVLSAESKSHSSNEFEGLVYLGDYLINYSLLKRGWAIYRYKAYTLDFWTRCKFEEENLNKKM